jgi:hypothetical protein
VANAPLTRSHGRRRRPIGYLTRAGLLFVAAVLLPFAIVLAVELATAIPRLGLAVSLDGLQ